MDSCENISKFTKYLILLLSAILLTSFAINCGKKKNNNNEQAAGDAITDDGEEQVLSQPEEQVSAPLPGNAPTNPSSTSKPAAPPESKEAILPKPVLREPSLTAIITNTDTLNISGECLSGATVFIKGSEESSCSCINNVFSFDITKTEDAIYDFAIGQFENEKNTSALAVLQWIRDTVAPLPINIISPASPITYSGGNELPFSGSCEQDAKITLSSESQNLEYACENASFMGSIQKELDGVYEFRLIQTDLAGNNSPPVIIRWNKNSEIPPSPVIAEPTKNPLYTSNPDIVISGSCLDSFEVKMSILPENSQELLHSESTTCANSVFSFNYNLASNQDGVYSVSLSQENPIFSTISEELRLSWVYDSQAPPSPSITTPISASVTTQEHTLSISGHCEENAIVFLSATEGPDQNTEETCQSGSYSFNIIVNQDGIYQYSLTQKDLAQNESSAALLTWTSDTQAPLAALVLVPSSNNTISNNPNFTISGTCDSDSIVKLRGSEIGESPCINNNFSFSLVKTVDQIYGFDLFQVDKAGNESEVITLSWQLDQIPPAAPELLSPLSENYVSGGDNFNFTLSCENGSVVQIAGDSSQNEPCQNQSVTINISKTVDGLYHFNCNQIDAAGNNSSSISLTWQRDTTQPAPVNITAPQSSQYFSNLDTLDINGTCSQNYLVEIVSGVDTNDVINPLNSLTQGCANGNWRFKLRKSADGTYPIVFHQTNPNNNLISQDSLFTWTKDTQVPSIPIITDPVISPFTSAANIFTITGECEPNATVYLQSSLENQDTPCQNSAFSFVINHNIDGVYDFYITQKDPASNESANTTVIWHRDTSIPATPSIISPSSSPHYGNQNTLVLAGSCAGPLYEVTVSGDIISSEVLAPAGILSQTCGSNDTYSFTLNKTSDGVFNLAVYQTNRLTQIPSAQRQLTWIRDTTVPSIPLITAPLISPIISPADIIIQGTCENFANVSLSGDDSQLQICASDSYQFTVSKSTDGTYQFSINQTDLAGNTSANATFSWQRDSSSIPPVTVLSPVTDGVFYSTVDQLNVTGTCIPSLTVTVTGDIAASESLIPLNALSQICQGTGIFNFVFEKQSTGSFLLNFNQTNFTGSSSNLQFQWIIDNTNPDLIFSVKPDQINLAEDAVFNLSSNESPVHYACSLDDDTNLSNCDAAISFLQISNGSHTFFAYAEDNAGNRSPVLSYAWEQRSYQTLALYHFDDSTGSTLDSSLYGPPVNNGLTDNGTNSVSTAKFAEGRALSASGTLAAPNSPTLGLTSSSMTIDGWIKVTTHPSRNNYATLISKSGAAQDLGWSIKLLRSRSTYRMAFFGSTDGQSYTEKRSSSFVLDLNRWYFFAVTWNMGEIKFYIDGNQVGSGSIGSVGSTNLFNSSGGLAIGNGLEPFMGDIDEWRISKSIRYTGSFAIPGQGFVAD